MTFPTYDQLEGSRFTPLNTPQVTYALTGEASTRTDYTKEPGIFRVFYLLTASELSTLRSNYDTNRRTSQTFTWQETDGSPADTYSVYWDGPPQFKRVTGDLYSVQVQLRVAT